MPMTPATKPRYAHDCDWCEYLGEFNPPMRSLHDDPDRVVDLYYCPDDRTGSVIARNSSEPGDYSSFDVNVLMYARLPADHELLEAMRRQIRRWISKS